MPSEAFIVVYILMAGGNYLVNSNYFFSSIMQAFVTCIFMYIFAQKRTKIKSSYLKDTRPKFKDGSKIKK